MTDSESAQATQDIVFEVVTRIRDVEGKYNLLRDRALIINQNMIEQYQKTHSEIKAINEDNRDKRRFISDKGNTEAFNKRDGTFFKKGRCEGFRKVY